MPHLLVGFLTMSLLTLHFTATTSCSSVTYWWKIPQHIDFTNDLCLCVGIFFHMAIQPNDHGLDKVICKISFSLEVLNVT